MRMFLIFTIVLVAAFSLTNAAVPTTMNYQGRLTDSGGTPLTGTYSIQFTIYADAGGSTSLWSETQLSVSTNDGFFSVLLGSVNAIPESIFDGSDRWLGIKVGTDPEISPLTQLSSVPGAFHASSVEGYSSGPNNVINGLWSSAAGDSNTVNADYSTVAGGLANVIDVSEIADTTLDTTDIFNNPGMIYTSFTDKSSPTSLGPFAFVGGGLSNHAHCSFSSIVGGFSNQSNGHFAFVGGGFGNRIGDDPNGCLCGNFSVIGGGAINRISGHFGTIGGGLTNRILNCYIGATIGGGRWNQTDNHVSTVGGGFRNFASGFASTVGGGEANNAILDYATVGGGQSNIAEAEYSTIAGGGQNDPTNPASNNVVYDMYGTIGGGGNNKVGSNNGITFDSPYGFIGGGVSNSVLSTHSSISGGESNTIFTPHGAIGGGKSNVIDGEYNVIAGGQNNTSANSHATVGGGLNNFAVDFFATISGGDSSLANAMYATVGGGHANQSINEYTVVSGGKANQATGHASAIGGGLDNISTNWATTVAGGEFNGAVGLYAAVGGGFENRAGGDSSVIAGGSINANDGLSSAIGGGRQNVINIGADRSVISGGDNNFANGIGAAIGGGAENIAGQGSYATVPGGFQNEAIGNNCFAAGQNAKAYDECSFVWSDCCQNADGTTGGPFYSNGPNSFNARATGGFYFRTSCDTAMTPLAGVYVPPGGGAWLTLSDVNSKNFYGNIDGRDILAQLDKLQISRWSYKTQDESIQHIGPTAQDFYRLFGVGDNDRSIATVDPDGIALAAIQALHAKTLELEDKSNKIEQLEAQMAEMQIILEQLLAERQ
jgi:trimeric autotransporter adhesin